MKGDRRGTLLLPLSVLVLLVFLPLLLGLIAVLVFVFLLLLFVLLVPVLDAVILGGRRFRGRLGLWRDGERRLRRRRHNR